MKFTDPHFWIEPAIAIVATLVAVGWAVWALVDLFPFDFLWP